MRRGRGSMRTPLQPSTAGEATVGRSLRLSKRVLDSQRAHRFRHGLLIAVALSLVGRIDFASPASIQSDNPNDYVQVRDGRFMLAGKPFVIKGTNYFGGWRYHQSIDTGNGIEFHTIWAFYHDWDDQKLDMDMQFIHAQLNATTLRVGTPAQADFADLVQFHDYQPWYAPDGRITEQYKAELIKIADAAYANGMRIQFCLLWNFKNEIAKDPDAFKLGARMDTLYANQVNSIVMALRSHPGVIGYSIGNEVLVDWPINGTHPSAYEGQAAGFILRRLKEVRAAAPRQLITIDEVGNPTGKMWYAPELAFVTLADVDTGNGRQSIRLADAADYLGTHFYPETLSPQDMTDGFASKIAEATQKIAIYMQAAKAFGKPVVLNEFGLRISPETLLPAQYSSIRDRFFQAILAEGQRQGLQGVLAWDAVPAFVLIPGQYTVKESTLNKFSPIEVDFDQPNHTQRRMLFYKPEYSLFEWRSASDVPAATPAARAIASAWPDISQPLQAPRP